MSTDAIGAIDDFRATVAAIRTEIGRVVVGHDRAIDVILCAFLAGGHVLIEGVPGIGKTLIVRALADALNLRFARIQFTVDLMPADVTGTRVIAEAPDGRRDFRFMPGPVFTNLLLADEINRATPKTQSALLEAMAERQVTVAGTSHLLPQPFFVLATLNPIEMEGTYPLPEAQLDRFLFKVLLESPSQRELEQILRATTGAETATVAAVLPADAAVGRVESLRRLVREVIVAPPLERYAARLVGSSAPRPDGDAEIRRYVRYGASPRAGQALLLGAKVLALLDGRAHVARQDVDALAAPALRHRLVLTFAAEADGVDVERLIPRVLEAAGRED